MCLELPIPVREQKERIKENRVYLNGLVDSPVEKILNETDSLEAKHSEDMQARK